MLRKTLEELRLYQLDDASASAVQENKLGHFRMLIVKLICFR
jgi:hypothetical protein